jgi:hypothetical protein
MFASYECKSLIWQNCKYTWEYEITDSEFGTVLGIATNKRESGGFNLEIAVIQEYSKRNLNVAANLMRAFIWLHKQYPDWYIQEMIDVNKKYNSFFSQYEKDIQKYLVLL